MTVLRSGSATDIGRVRGTNQDLHLVTADLFAVADGMGGHAGGEVAASDAIDALRQAFMADPSIEGLRRAVVEANAAVWRHSQQRQELRGMGTTLTALALVPDEEGQDLLALANVGDSRAYVFSEGGVTQVTADHSLAEEKVRHGELTEAEAAVHPHRHILTRALGISSDVQVDVWSLRLRSGDRVLLCSDGLSNEVSAEEIGWVLGSVADPDDVARTLVARANDHGGSDNITVVVVDVVVGGDETEPLVPPPTTWSGVAGTAAPGAPLTSQDTDGGREPSAGTPTNGAGSTGRGPATATRVGTVVDARPAPVAVGTAPPLPSPRPPQRLSRRQQRRQAGIPPRVTFRVLLFVLLLAAVVVAAYGVVRWYATDNWFVTVRDQHLVIYQGRSGGLLWFHPKLVQTTPVTTSDVLPIRLPSLRSNVDETSLHAARKYVDNLYKEFIDQQQLAHRQSTAVPGTTTTVPSTTVPSTTVPSAGLPATGVTQG